MPSRADEDLDALPPVPPQGPWGRFWGRNKLLIVLTLDALLVIPLSLVMTTTLMGGSQLMRQWNPEGFLVLAIFFVPPMIVGVVIAWRNILRDRRGSRDRPTPLNFDKG